MINLMEVTPNKVSTNLSQYSIIIMGDTGVGKTTGMMNFLKSLNPEKEPLFLEFEDRFQNIPGISAVKISSMSDFISTISQLKNPALKNKFSSIVIDTEDKFEELCEEYVKQNADAEILKDVGNYGEGTLRFKNSLRKIGQIQNLGYTVHFIAQSNHNKDFDTNEEMDSLKLNKNTRSYTRESAYLIGYMYIKDNERYITFKKSSKFPDLKDTFGMPDEVKFSELKEVWENAIKNRGEEFITNESTIDRVVKKEDFNLIKSKGIKFGSALADKGHVEEAIAVLKKNLGTDDDGNVKMFDSLRESQIDLTKIIVMELEELVKKYNIEVE